MADAVHDEGENDGDVVLRVPAVCALLAVYLRHSWLADHLIICSATSVVRGRYVHQEYITLTKPSTNNAPRSSVTGKHPAAVV